MHGGAGIGNIYNNYMWTRANAFGKAFVGKLGSGFIAQTPAPGADLFCFTDPDLPAERHPDVLHALAELREAEADLKAATVRAPRDAITANVRLQSGEHVGEGDPILSLVSTGGFWIEANLKETELTHLREGQAATFEIDAYPGFTWMAAVESVAPATGSEYGRLPPRNDSGNWVKVVQRVPVRLMIFPEPEAPALRAGMSARVVIDTRFERPVPEFVNVARAWVLPDRL